MRARLPETSAAMGRPTQRPVAGAEIRTLEKFRPFPWRQPTAGSPQRTGYRAMSPPGTGRDEVGDRPRLLARFGSHACGAGNSIPMATRIDPSTPGRARALFPIVHFALARDVRPNVPHYPRRAANKCCRTYSQHRPTTRFHVSIGAGRVGACPRHPHERRRVVGPRFLAGPNCLHGLRSIDRSESSARS